MAPPFLPSALVTALPRRRRARSTTPPRRPRTTGTLCGILVFLTAREGARSDSPPIHDFLPGLARRGPDGVGAWHRRVGVPPLGRPLGDGTPHWDCHILGSLLQLRGTTPSASPLVDVRGNVLAFSGELFAGVAVGSGAENDAAALLATFDEVFAKAPNDEGLAASALVAGLRGPWALAYWHEASQRLWFGRDVFGRRSLLLRRGGGRGSSARDGDAPRGAPRPTTLTLTSVAPERAADDPDVPDPDVPEDEEKTEKTEKTDEWEELEPGLYGVDRARRRGKTMTAVFSPRRDARAAAPPRRGALAERLLRFRRARAATRPAVEKTNETKKTETERRTRRGTPRWTVSWRRSPPPSSVASR